MRVTQGTFSDLPDFTDDQIAAQLRYSLRNGWAIMVEHTDDPHPRNALWEMWAQPQFDLTEHDVDVAMADVRAAREALPHAYVKVVAYDRSLGRQTSKLSFIVSRPPQEPGFRLDRQEGPDRQVRYTLHSYATEQPPGGALPVSAAVDGGVDLGALPERARVQETLETLDHDLVALEPVKTRVREIAALLVIDRLREQSGIATVRPSLHMSFTGNPGTGKTTVALRMADILHSLGYLDEAKLVSVSRDDLVGQYVGHTAPKTKEVLKRAYGGVLFIDEAYFLERPENERDYGQEAIEVLLHAMEADRERLVVIFAGYADRMEVFFRQNPGMGSRVAHHLNFPDYSVDELAEIGELMARERAYELTPEATAALHAYAERRIREPRFANARSIRNAIDRARLRQATRLFERDGRLTPDDLVTIEAEDILRSSVFTH